MKLCPKCKTEKSTDLFYKCKKNASDLQSYCKSCIKVANASWAENNKDKFKDYQSKFRGTDKRKQYIKLYKEQKADFISARRKEYKEENSERIKEGNRLYAKLNSDKIRSINKKYYEENRELILSKSKEYRRKNKSRYAKHSSLRRATERRAQPTWLTREDLIRMELIWGLRELKSFVTKEEYEVDHIVPLRGKTVCGLHVPWNLRVILRYENRSKHARYWPDMWTEEELKT